jgi:hypothetical protein
MLNDTINIIATSALISEICLQTGLSSCIANDTKFVLIVFLFCWYIRTAQNYYADKFIEKLLAMDSTTATIQDFEQHKQQIFMKKLIVSNAKYAKIIQLFDAKVLFSESFLRLNCLDEEENYYSTKAQKLFENNQDKYKNLLLNPMDYVYLQNIRDNNDTGDNGIFLREIKKIGLISLHFNNFIRTIATQKDIQNAYQTNTLENFIKTKDYRDTIKESFEVISQKWDPRKYSNTGKAKEILQRASIALDILIQKTNYQATKNYWESKDCYNKIVMCLEGKK